MNRVYRVKDWQAARPHGRPLSEDQTEDKCPVSLFRAAMISKNPSRVHEIVLTLSENCFDVMMMRKWEPGLQSALNTELVIADMTACMDGEQFDEERKLLNPAGDRISIPVLYLVNEELMSRASGSLLEEELMVWIPRSRETMMYQIQRTIRANSQALLSSEDMRAGRGQVFKDLRIDRDKMSIHRGRMPIHLTKTEYNLLVLLLDSGGAVRTREELMSEIWDTDFLGGSNVIDVHIKSLRKKLNDKAGSPRYIATVRGVGYRLAD